MKRARMWLHLRANVTRIPPALFSPISPTLWESGFYILFLTSFFHMLEWPTSVVETHNFISREQLLVEFCGPKYKNPGKVHSTRQTESDVHPIPIIMATKAGCMGSYSHHWNHLHRGGERSFPEKKDLLWTDKTVDIHSNLLRCFTKPIILNIWATDF